MLKASSVQHLIEAFLYFWLVYILKGEQKCQLKENPF